MKAMEPGAPMISVPAGVLKEFMSPTNSRTPTPPLSAAVTVSNITNKNFLPTLSSASNSNSRTSSPILPSSIDISAVTVNSVASVSTPELSTSVALTNGQVSKDDSVSDSENEENKKSKTFDKKEEAPEKRSIPEVLVNGVTSGVKRTSEDEGGSEKPDLKKIRVFKPTPEDVHKTIKEFNQHLDQVSKKYGDSDIQENKDLATINELRSCYNNVPAGAGVVSGVCSGDGNSSVVGQANVATKALVNSGQSKDVEVLTATPKMREVLTPISKEREIINSNMRERVTTVVDKENKQIKRRLQRLPRKELENMIMRQFSEKTLYQCELGKMKQLCEKLETTLESNRKKTAQFHKEIEDLRKVTNRLSAEHLSRKGQYVAPIRIKRSVGIQAAPHIINKGIMHASGSGGLIKTIAPRPSSLVGVSSSSSPVKPYHLVASEVCSPPNVTFQTKMIPTSSTQQSLITQGTVGILAQSQPSIGRPQAMNNMGGTTGLPTMATSAPGLSTIRPTAGQMLMMTAAGAMQALPRATNAGVVNAATAVLPVAQGRVVRAPLGGLTSVVSATGTLLNGQRPMLVQSDKAVTGTTAALQTPLSSRGSGVIDLTDEDEGTKRPTAMVPKPGTLVKVPTSGTAQLLPLQQAGGVGQVVLLPQMSGGQPTTALIVSQVSTGMTTLDSMTSPTVAQARIGSLGSHTTNSRVMGSVVNTTHRTTTSTLPQANQMRHPAQLPKTPFQQVGGLSKKLPPQPTLKLSHKDSSIVLSWTMSKTEDHETIASYQLYAYQEGAAAPSPNLWKKVGSVKALELPMACTLTQFMPGHVYHFAVRAVDIKSRLGPFSEPRSIRLDKK
ncbi:activating transcription factor 7-interacting protein 1 isoform X8 [Procambarus clarkii]|uniref:activating transcription factor 7-interacting protein 1 isoform X8 n=1 Tax=Procambarus clarkii TaxID=6728 RepID=UPI003743F1CF